MPCFSYLPEKKGRSVAISPSLRPGGAHSRSAEACHPESDTPSSTRPVRLRRAWGKSGQDLDGLGDVPVDSGGADPETGHELGIELTVAEVGEGKQGPVGPRSGAAIGYRERADAPSGERLGSAGQNRTCRRRTGKQAREAPGGDGSLVRNPIYQGFIRVSGQLPN